MRDIRGETLERILDAARRLFSTRGADRVSVREVAEAAGVTHPLVHHYFGSKKELLEAVVQRELATLSAIADRLVADRGGSSGGLALRSFLDHVLENPEGLRLIVRAELDGLSPETMAAGSPRTLAFLSDSLIALQSATPGEDRPDPRVVCAVMAAAVFGILVMEPYITDGAGLQCDARFREQFCECVFRVAMLAQIPGKQLPAVPRGSVF